MIDNLGVGKVAVEGKVAGNLLLAGPIDQLAAELGVVAELRAGGLARLALAEPTGFQWIVLPPGAGIVGNPIVVADLVPLLGMVPEPSGALDELSVVVCQHVVDGNQPPGSTSRSSGASKATPTGAG